MLKLNFDLIRIFILFFSIFSWTFTIDNGYYIKDYSINIVIDEKNKYSIQESIEVFFTLPKRGIIRSIPSIYGDKNIKLTNIKVNAPYTEERFNSGVSLRIGDSKTYITGKKIYNISYNYDMGWDGIDSYDEVYFNLIGNQWDTTIEKVNFTIELPKDFDSKNINFTSGEFGDITKGNVEFTVDNNIIKGFTTSPLKPGEALTLALNLPQNYFLVRSPRIILNILKLCLHGLTAIFPILALFLWYRFGKNKPFVETVEFYPPENMTPSEVGYFIDGRIDTRDITSLIIYWADKGYLSIEEVEKQSFFGKNSIALTKLKELNNNGNSYENYFFENLFSFSRDGKTVQFKDLENRFYKYIEKTYSLMRIDIFTKYSTLYTGKSLAVGNFITSLPLLALFLVLIYNSIERNLKFFSIGNLSGISLFITQYPFLLISIFFTVFIGAKTRKYTEESHNRIGKVRGFKNFLITAEKERLEMLIHENPSYFYNILPYTIVLGVSDKWANKFIDLVKEPPNWYHSTSRDVFMLSVFMNSFNRSFSNFEKNLYSVPPSNKGPGASSIGGGSAGGGAGGGGGSSW